MALKYLDDHGLETLWSRIKALVTNSLGSYYTKTEVDEQLDDYEVPDGAITTNKLDEESVTTEKIADGAVGVSQIDPAIPVSERYFQWVFGANETSTYNLFVPLDFTKYRKIVIDVSYQPGIFSGPAWGEMYPLLGSTPATVRRTGHEFRGTTYERMYSQNVDHTIAIGAASETPSQGHLEMECYAPNAFVTFRGHSVGASSASMYVQDMWGKIHHNGETVTSMRIKLRNPMAGGRVVAYGYKR